MKTDGPTAPVRPLSRAPGLERILSGRADGATTVAFFLCSVLLAWNAALALDAGPIAGVLFLLGPFLGLGVLLGLSIDATETLTTLAVVGLACALVATAFLGGFARYGPVLPFSTAGLAAGFDAVFLAVLGYLWRFRRERLTAVRVPAPDTFQTLLAAACLVAIAVGYLAFRTKATSGSSVRTALVYGWILGTFVTVFVRRRSDATSHVLVVLTAALLIIWSQSLSTNALFAVDGLEITRWVRAHVFGVNVNVYSPRHYHSLGVSGLLSGLSLLSTWSPYAIAKFVVPTVAATSAVGVYQLAREWLDPGAAFVGAFLLCFQYSFFFELPTNYRSSVAFPVLVALYLVVWESTDRRRAATALVFLTAILLLHDTVGVFVMGALTIATALALGLRYRRPTSLSRHRLLELFSLTCAGGLGFYLFYGRDQTFEEFAIRGVSLVAGIVSEVSFGAESSRTVDTAVDSLGTTLIGLLRQSAIYAQVGLMALVTAVLLVGLVWQDRLTRRLPWHRGEAFHEVLLVANAAWFGALVLRPLLGLPRVFLYASPLLVGLVAFVVQQFAVPGVGADGGAKQGATADTGTATSPETGPRATTETRTNAADGGSRRFEVAGRGPRTVLTGLLIVLLVFAFVTQTGLVAFALGGDVFQPSFSDPRDPAVRYFHEADVEANEWVLSHTNNDFQLYVDKLSYALLVDDPGIEHNQPVRIRRGTGMTTILSEGCLFVRTNNGYSGQLYVNAGPGGHAEPVDYPLERTERYNTVYAAGQPKIVC